MKYHRYKNSLESLSIPFIVSLTYKMSHYLNISEITCYYGVSGPSGIYGDAGRLLSCDEDIEPPTAGPAPLTKIFILLRYKKFFGKNSIELDTALDRTREDLSIDIPGR